MDKQKAIVYRAITEGKMETKEGYYPEVKKYEKEFTNSLGSEKLCEYTMQRSSNDIGKHYRALYHYCKWLEEQVGGKDGKN